MAAAINSDTTAGGTSLQALLAEGYARLAGASETPRLDAELLLATLLGVARSSIIAFPDRLVSPSQASDFRRLLQRRADREPLAYITGRREFYSLELEVSPRVLVPRPETELLVEVLLERLQRDDSPEVLDLGTGSGALALAVKRERPRAQVWACDVSRAALRVAQRNAVRHGLQVSFVRSDWFAALGPARFDFLLCNPPYVPSADPHFDGPLRFEPRLALDGGPDGLDAIRAILRAAAAKMRPGARLLMEHGHDQHDAVSALALEHNYRVCAARSDLAGRARLIVLEVA